MARAIALDGAGLVLDLSELELMARMGNGTIRATWRYVPGTGRGQVVHREVVGPPMNLAAALTLMKKIK